ncbi:MAG: M56 family metallopeptidase [Bacteroidota bacterium]
MLFGYLLLGYLISGIGFLLYSFLLKKKGSPLQRKIYLYTILAVSLLLPYPLFKYVAPETSLAFIKNVETEKPELAENTIAFSEISACYNKALDEKEFCACEELEFNNIIIFQEDHFMETCLDCKSYLGPLAWILISIILSALLIRVGYLIYIVRTSRRSEFIFDGKTYTQLSNHRTPIAASFRLFKKYIIWDETLEKLTKDEKDAVYYHEIAHLKNLDTWEQICLSILRIFWFANPVFYKIRTELRLISEFLADAFAVSKTGNPQHYAALLIRLKEQQNHNLYHGFGSEDLRSRILNIIKPSPGNKSRFVSFMLASLFLMVSTGFLAAPPIKSQMKSLEQYELLHSKKSETGNAFFCKACILEELQENCNFE